MKVVITGASGFIGRYLATALRGQGNTVVGVGRSEAVALSGSTDLLQVHTDYSLPHLESLLAQVDVVIHLAGRRSQRSDHLLSITPFVEPNLSLLERLLDASASARVKKFVFASTIAAYSQANAVPYQESDKVSGLNPYGWSKIAGEGLVDLWGRSGHMQTTSLRLAAGFGYGERLSAVLMRFIDQASRKEPLIVRGNRHVGVDQLYVKDIVGAFMAAIAPNARNGLFNIGSGRAYRLEEMALAVANAFPDVEVRFEDDPAVGAAGPYMDTTAASTGLGWCIEWPLEKALADVYDTWCAATTPIKRGSK
ncbi:NAD(P)-dependent oxidoreductase [Brevundimonas intermedia]|uniref:NAD(P)-dependent oxidoreductase n=1 Tax=Brevundimonas intermedia TaxID=74315 RepID=A0A4Y9RWM6_9CAUL|nr:NAD(P)-dependent oxidoreductase [Brevundimonas intermedia]TFW13550.1 NAD(P)-dependent oxidoreductase [Brevundimonas intermedia]